MMRAVLVLSVVALASAYHYLDHLDLDDPLESEEIIQAVNNANTTWKAGRNFDPALKKSHLKYLLGLKERPEGTQLPPPLEDDEDEYLELPESFDSREKWSYCISLQQVRDQGDCGSCWAVSAAAALTDRFCIATEGKFNGHLSGQDLLSCCECGNCEKGGYDYLAWQYFRDTGICTGGDYQSEEGCQPYLLPSCEHHVSGPRKNCSAYNHGHVLPTPKCQNSCYNKKYKFRPKDQDLYKAKYVFQITNDVIKKTQMQIFKHGPVQAGFYVYEDFLSYKSGVYRHKHGECHGGHAVKVIGWGTEDGTDYWLVANSWNSDWGDKGFFKIRRGNDECFFESFILGGYPDV